MEEHVSNDVKRVLVNSVMSKGSVSLADLRVALDEASLTVKVDDAQLFHAVQRIPELFFMPEVVFLRHVLKAVIVETPEEELIVELSSEALAAKAAERTALLMADAENSQDVAMQFLTEAAADLPAAETEHEVTAAVGDAEEGASTAPGFFSFGDFSKQPEMLIAQEPESKKRRLEDTSSDPKAWSADLPPWVTEGAAITVRKEHVTAVDEVGVILRVTGRVATVRLILGETAGLTGTGGMAGAGLGREADLPISMLLPVAPTVGSSVKVISGKHRDCQGKLVGLAGPSGVVQIGSLNYETVPLNHIAVLASWR